jgi:hypothetical protein
MTTTASTQPGARTAPVRSTRSTPVRDLRETKPSFMTTEFWAMLAGIVGIAVIYNASADASLNLFRACLLGTVIATGYIVSRGFAKAGSHDDHWIDDDSRTS